jgi:AcrR family transcriptional regulator
MASQLRQERKVETRERLLLAARAVLEREGLAGATSRKIADEAGVAVGTVFLHFERVEHLVGALLDQHLAAAIPRALRAATRKRGLVAQLTHATRILFASYDKEPELARAWLAASLFGPSEDARVRQFAAWVGERVTIANDSSEVDTIEADLAFQVYFSLYFTALVAGLRGALTRRQQLRFVERALTRFFHPSRVVVIGGRRRKRSR